jgi:hypothetical protein
MMDQQVILFQQNTAKLLQCELLLMLVAKLQQRYPKIIPLISILLFVHLSSLSLSLFLSHGTGLSSQTLCSQSPEISLWLQRNTQA